MVKKVLFLQQISKAMKKLLPIMLFVLLAFAACQRGPVMYEKAENPRQLVGNVEKFVNQTEKKAKHYTAEDWQVAVDQFVVMCKDYVENGKRLTEDEQMRFDKARVQFVNTVGANGNDELVGQIKEIYGNIIN